MFDGNSRESHKESQRVEVKNRTLERMGVFALEHMEAIHGSGWVWIFSEIYYRAKWNLHVLVL